MTTYYSQIQYVPDPIAGERINVGLVAVDASGCAYKFIRDWRRAATFGGQDVGFLREFAEEASEKGRDWFSLEHRGSAQGVAVALRRWHNKIQFSELRASTKARDELLSEMAVLFLRISDVDGTTAATHVGRGRDKAVASASKSLATAMRARFGHAPRGLLQRDIPLRGQIESHQLDVALKNGVLYGGAFAVSFETGSPKMQQRDTDAIAFAIEDISRQKSAPPLAVVVLPPSSATPTYSRARHIFHELDVPLVLEKGLTRWAEGLVGQLPENAVAA